MKNDSFFKDRRCLFCEEKREEELVRHHVIILKLLAKINITVEPSLTVVLCKDCKKALDESHNSEEFLQKIPTNKEDIVKRNFKEGQCEIENAIKLSAMLFIQNPELCGKDYGDVVSYYPDDAAVLDRVDDIKMTNNMMFGAYVTNYKDYGITDRIKGLKYHSEREMIKYIKENIIKYISSKQQRLSETTLKKYINDKRSKKKYQNKFTQKMIETAIQELVNEGVIEEEIKEKYIKSKSKTRRIKIKMYKLA